MKKILMALTIASACALGVAHSAAPGGPALIDSDDEGSYGGNMMAQALRYQYGAAQTPAVRQQPASDGELALQIAAAEKASLDEVKEQERLSLECALRLQAEDLQRVRRASAAERPQPQAAPQQQAAGIPHATLIELLKAGAVINPDGSIGFPQQAQAAAQPLLPAAVLQEHRKPDAREQNVRTLKAAWLDAYARRVGHAEAGRIDTWDRAAAADRNSPFVFHTSEGFPLEAFYWEGAFPELVGARNRPPYGRSQSRMDELKNLFAICAKDREPQHFHARYLTGDIALAILKAFKVAPDNFHHDNPKVVFQNVNHPIAAFMGISADDPYMLELFSMLHYNPGELVSFPGGGDRIKGNIFGAKFNLRVG